MMLTYEKIMKPTWLKFLWILFLAIFSPPTTSAAPNSDATSTGLFSEPQYRAPTFTVEPPNRIDFLNEEGAVIVCQADGYPKPQITWIGSDNKYLLPNVDNFRTVLSNSTLLIHPFKPASYRQDVHSTTVHCVASNVVGALKSRDIQIRTVIPQEWSVKVLSSPAHYFPGDGPILMQCEMDLMGGGRDFIEVTGWKLNEKFITRRFQRFYEMTEDAYSHWHALPNGDLMIEVLLEEDAQSKLVCITRHKITRQEISSSPLSLTFSKKPNQVEEDGSNISESFPTSIVVVQEGDPIVLHCYVHGRRHSSPASKSDANIVRWEKLAGSWISVPSTSSSIASKYLRNIGNSLVVDKSTKGHEGHYRCLNSKEILKEFEVKVNGEMSVKLTINQPKVALDSTAELTCEASQHSASITWLKDSNLINPNGRIRLFPTKLQINQIKQGDEGTYQCFVGSAQASIQLELADVQPTLLYGYIDQTLSPGPSVSLRCVFRGWPIPTITWHRENFWPVTSSYDSRVLIGNVTSQGQLISYLNVTQTRVEDSGLYSCMARSRAGTSVHSSRLNIYGPQWIRVVSPIIATSGEFFVLTCPISGWPISFGKIIWEKDGQKLPLNTRQRIGTNGSLTITVIDKSDSGNYWCSISQMRREIKVNVVAPLRIAPFSESGQVLEGERMTLVCTLSSGEPANIKWEFLPHKHQAWNKISTAMAQFDDTLSNFSSWNNGPLYSVLKTDPFTSLLSIGKVHWRNMGKYICEASGTEDSRNVFRSYDLTVLVPPKIEEFAFKEGLQENMMTRVVCGVSSGDLPIQFEWFKDGRLLTMNNIEISSLDSYSTLLRFSSLDSSMSGLYSCRARNSASQAHFSARLLVQVAPRWVKEPTDINVTRGREAQLHCSGFGIPPPKVKWLKSTGDGVGDGKWRPVETIFLSTTAPPISLANGSLIFPVVEEVHGEGQYMCTISNGIGSGLSKIVQLHVLVKPYFVGSESRPIISLTQGTTREISCEAISSSPIYLTWSKGTTVFVNVPANRIHTKVVMEGRRSSSTLVMRDIRSDDGDMYKCIASNIHGKATRAYRLVVEEQPSAPQHLRFGEESQRNGPEATRVYLEWDPPSEYSSKENVLPGEHATRPSQRTTVFPPILMYVLEFSLAGGEAKTRSVRHIEVSGEKRWLMVEALTPASEYVFRLFAVNAAGRSEASQQLFLRTANIPPSLPPNNVRASAVSSRAILVTWSPIPSEMTFGKILAYHIVVTAESLGTPETILVPAATSFTSFHNNQTVNEQNCCQVVIHGPSILPYTHYTLRLSALNVAGAGPQSAPFSLKTTEEAPQLPPRNPQCLSLTSHSIQISWQHPTNGPITSYKVTFYPLDFNPKIHGGSGEIHKTSGLTAVIGGLEANGNYSFHITPMNMLGEGRESLSVFCKTSEDVPSSPSNLIGFTSSETSVYLSWLLPQKPNGILTHHTIYFRMIDKTSDSFEIKRTVPGNADYYEESGLDLSRFKYVFWITSSNRMGESQPSSQLMLNPPHNVETRLVGQSRSVEIHQGNPLILPCRLVGLASSFGGFGHAKPEDFVSWTRNGKRLTFDGNVYTKPGHSDLFFMGVRKSNQGNYSCHMKIQGGKTSKSTKKVVINGMESQQLTYTLQVKGIPCTPEPSYRVLERDIVIMWKTDEHKFNCDLPLGFILYYRALGSILDWRKVVFQPTSKNYTLKEITCGSILNMYMVSFNEVGNSPDSHLMSVVVSNSVAPFKQSSELIVPNITSVLLNLYPLNSNLTFCPVEKFSVAIREWQSSSEWLAGRDVQIQFRNEYAIDGLKASTPYEITVTTFGYSSSRKATFTFTTLTFLGETPEINVLGTNKGVMNSALYSNLTLILPSLGAIIAISVAIIAAIVYCRTRRTTATPTSVPHGSVANESMSDPDYGYIIQKKIIPRQEFYSGLQLPRPPCNQGLDDISPYATFQISDPKKFHEETFSQEIVVGKFHPVMHGLPRGSRDKWMDRDPRQTMQDDSGDSESENAQRYSVQRSRQSNLYQINPPTQPPPLLYQSMAYHHHHPPSLNVSDPEDGDSSSSDPSRTTTIDRRTGKKERGRKGKKSQRFHEVKQPNSSCTSIRRNKRKSTNSNSDYSIAV